MDISGNTAVVSASSSGLGKASAMALAREGVDVIVNGRYEDRLKAAVADIEAMATGRVVGHAGDITRREDIVSLVEHAADEFGRLNHVVTSAGGPARMRPLDASDED